MADGNAEPVQKESPDINLSDAFAQSLEISSKPTEAKPGDVARATLTSWLGATFKVGITDGRVIVGTFVCTDREGNLILENSWEYAPWDNDDKEPRQLCLALIPGQHLKSICIPASLT